MSMMPFLDSIEHCCNVAKSLVILLWILGIAPAEATVYYPPEAPCSAVETLMLNSTLRSPGDSQKASGCYQLFVPEPGMLMLDVSASDAAPARPLLRFLGADTDGGQQQGFSGAHQVLLSPQNTLVEIRVPGTFLLRVESEDPARSLPVYKLRNTFVAESAAIDGWPGARVPTGTLAPSDSAPSKKCIRVDPWDDSGQSDPGVLTVETTDTTLHIPMHGDPTCREDPNDKNFEEAAAAVFPLDPSFLSANPKLKFFPFCRTEPDDHSDIRLCATSLAYGQEVSGWISMPYGEDEDYFTFLVDAQQVIVLEIMETASIMASLYDSQGQLLISTQTSDVSPTTRIVRSLAPGRYFVRLESSESVGEAYAIQLRALRM